MIEVEKKFILTQDEEERLLAGATFLEQKTNTDAYYDNEQYAVTLADCWLRNRNGSFELKVPLSKDNGSQGVNVYHELTEEADIREALRLPYDTSDLAHDIEAAGYRVFVQPTSSRRSYEKDGYHIDVDTVAYEGSDFTYAVAEIELLVQDESDAPKATEQIVTYAKSLGLQTDGVILGKVAAFLRARSPEHYKALKISNILR